MQTNLHASEAEKSLEPLLFRGWKAEEQVLENECNCCNCGEKLSKGTTAIVVSRLKKKRRKEQNACVLQYAL